MRELTAEHLPYLVIINLAVVALVLVILGKVMMARPLTELPSGRQNAAELMLEWFVRQARDIHPQRVALIASFLATLFLLILGCNLLAFLPIPLLQMPPTAYFSVPLGLALIAVIGVFLSNASIGGFGAAVKHTFWPNPLQLIGEVSHTVSLSLRLYGNIGGEYIVSSLVAQSVPYGIPIVIHALGLIPATVQPLVFTLLTANFLATAVHTGARGRAPHRTTLGIARTP